MKIYILNDTRSDRHHGCSIVMRNLINGLRQRGAIVVHTLRSGAVVTPTEMEKIRTSDVVVINGEGTIHSQKAYAKHLLQTGLQAKEMGKRVFLLNSIWESNDESMARIVEKYDGIWVRDSASAAELSEYGVKAIVVPDLTFGTLYPKQKSTGTSIQVSDSVYAETSKALREMAAQHTWQYTPIIRPPLLCGAHKASLKWIKWRLRAFLTCLTLGRYTPRQAFIDMSLCLENTPQYLSTLGNARALVSGRFHAVCLALQQRVPFVAVHSNTNKIANLLKDIGLDSSRHLKPLEVIGQYDESNLLATANYTPYEEEALEHFLNDAHIRIQEMLTRVSAP